MNVMKKKYSCETSGAPLHALTRIISSSSVLPHHRRGIVDVDNCVVNEHRTSRYERKDFTLFLTFIELEGTC